MVKEKEKEIKCSIISNESLFDKNINKFLDNLFEINKNKPFSNKTNIYYIINNYIDWLYYNNILTDITFKDSLKTLLKNSITINIRR